MPLAPHRKHPDRVREARERAWAEVERKLGGGKQICGRCGASLRTFDEKCVADLDESCPGFEAIDLVRSAALQKARCGA